MTISDKRKLLAMHLFVISMLMAPIACAQFVGRNPGPCPAGSAPVNGSCGSPSNATGSNTREVWRSRYGAIAASPGGAVVGFSEGQYSLYSAKKLALKRCEGAACRIVMEVENGCGAAAWGPDGSGILGFAGGSDKVAAENNAVSKCRESGGGACAVIGVGCSLPVRIR